MISIDSNQIRIKPYRSLIKGDELADRICIDGFDCKGDGMSAFFKQGVSGAEHKAMEVIATGHSIIIYLNRISLTVFENFNEGGEKVGHAFPKLLDICMLVRGSFVAVYRNALINKITDEVFSLPRDSMINC